MAVTFRSDQKIVIDSRREAEFWSAQFGASVDEIIMAISAVGDIFENVKNYLDATREPVGSYIEKMRSRLSEIELQVAQLTEERRGIVTFLEGFVQLQRTQRSTKPNEAVMPGVSAVSFFSTTVTLDQEKRHDERSNRSSNRSSGMGSSILIIETVYTLLADGKRRSIQELISFLEIRGIPLKGANPAGFLSTLLSRDDRFDASRRDGWGLA